MQCRNKRQGDALSYSVACFRTFPHITHEIVGEGFKPNWFKNWWCIGLLRIGGWSQGASFSRDGSGLVVGNMNQKNMQVFKNDNGKLTDTGQTIDTVGGSAAVRASTDR